MKISIEDIKDTIRGAIKEYLGISDIDDEKNLLSSDLNIIVPDFLYVLDVLEKTYGKNVYQIFEQNNYTIFSVNGLSQAIFEQCSH